METLEDLRRFISSEAGPGVDIRGVGIDEDLLALGIIDSMTLLKLVSFMEERFEIKILDEDISKQNFRSLQALSAFVAFKQSEM